MSMKTEIGKAMPTNDNMGWIVAIVLVLIMTCGIVYNSMRVARLEAGMHHLEVVVEKNKHDIVNLFMRQED